MAAAVALAGGTLLGVAGCGAGSSAAPHTLPPLSISPSAAPSVTAASPSTPATTGKKAELAAATAVVRRYYAVLNDLHKSMNADDFATLFTRTCPCQQQVRAVRLAKAKGEHYIDQVHLIKMTPSVDGPNSADVLVLFNARVGGLVDRHNRQLTSAPAARNVHRDFALAKRGGRWLISRLEVV